MSARLKLKKLKRELEIVRDHCTICEAEVRAEKFRYYKLLQENIHEIGASIELYPCETMVGAVEHLKYSVYKISDAIVRKYTEQLADFVHDQLTKNYALNKFSTIGVTLLAPAINENHIKVKVR